jgi:uncharacterized membrane protein (DUF4010 family)
MEDSSYFLRFGVSLIIGILVGFQRQTVQEDPDYEYAAGVRTFGLVGLLGCSAGLICEILSSPWPLVAAILIIGTFLSINYYIEASSRSTGLTTNTAVILTFLAGTLAFWNHLPLAIALGVITTLILSVKKEMHGFARKVTRADIFASLKFAVITAIVLPILPNKNYGIPPIEIFNPFKIWLLVILISGISLVGYILVKVVGARRGIGITGLMGGLASSTALTLSFTQRSRQADKLSKSLAMAIIIAWTVMFGRVVIEVGVLNIQLARQITIPMAFPVVVGLGYCIFLYRSQRDKDDSVVKLSNPFELGPAIKFGLIFTVILAVSRLAQVYFGDAGIYFSGFFSGLADADAIALSLADLSRGASRVPADTAARAILISALSNTLAKGGIVIFAGAAPLRRAILPGFLLMLVAGIAGAFLI